MKKIGCVLLVVLVGVGLVAGFVGITIWSIVRGEDQIGLTREVPAVVLHPRKLGGSGGGIWKFDYAYRADGRWYGSSGFLLPASRWSLSDGADICLDPEDPRRHALATDRLCGSEFVSVGGIDTATPRPAPPRASADPEAG